METEDPHIPDAETRKLQRYRRIWALVGTIPAGEVATYGQIAFVNELSTPRLAGRALAHLPPNESRPGGVPWHRVLNSSGRTSRRRDGGRDGLQRSRLIAEGIVFLPGGRVDFRTAGWRGPQWEWLDANGYDVGALIDRGRAIRRSGPWSRWAL